MGVRSQTHFGNTIKTILAVALFGLASYAVAEPEADPEAYGYGYRGGYGGYRGYGGYYRGKRDAEANPDANAAPEAYRYGHGYGGYLGGYRGYGYGGYRGGYG